jgi:DNA-binding GntR family transcriptional regulator
MQNARITYQPLDHIDLTERTYRVLKEKILRGELKPGAQISAPEVALALRVSRTPVTDALKRLAGEGLVEILPRQGTFVTELTARDIAEIFGMRQMIEMYAAEIVLNAGAAAQFLEAARAPIAAMEQAIDGEQFRDYEAFTSNDREFHTALVTLTGNSRLIRAYNHLHVHTHGARVHYLDGDDAQRAQREHQAILQAFERGSVSEAKEALRVHISSVQTRILELLEHRGGQL